MLKNNKYSTPVTFEFAVSRCSNKINVFERNTNIFRVMKFVNNTTLRITSSGKRFEHPKEFPSEQDYVKIFTLENQLQKQRKIFVCCQIESSIRMGEFKYGDEIVMHYLIELHTFMKKNKFSTH